MQAGFDIPRCLTPFMALHLLPLCRAETYRHAVPAPVCLSRICISAGPVATRQLLWWVRLSRQRAPRDSSRARYSALFCTREGARLNSRAKESRNDVPGGVRNRYRAHFTRDEQARWASRNTGCSIVHAGCSIVHAGCSIVHAGCSIVHAVRSCTTPARQSSACCGCRSFSVTEPASVRAVLPSG